MQVGSEVRAGHDFQRAGDYAPGIGDSNTGADVPYVQGGDAPAVGVWQDLLPAGEALVQDLPHPGQGVGDGPEVAAASLGHRRAPAPTAA